jgi:hypothetical protein
VLYKLANGKVITYLIKTKHMTLSILQIILIVFATIVAVYTIQDYYAERKG